MGKTLVSYFGDMSSGNKEGLSTAIKNLSTFTLVGFQTHLSEFHNNLSELLSVSIPASKINVSPNATEAKRIKDDSGAMHAIRELCELDLALWNEIAP